MEPMQHPARLEWHHGGGEDDPTLGFRPRQAPPPSPSPWACGDEDDDQDMSGLEWSGELVLLSSSSPSTTTTSPSSSPCTTPRPDDEDDDHEGCWAGGWQHHARDDGFADSPASAGGEEEEEAHAQWLRETNAALQEAMVYLAGSVALRKPKDEQRALEWFRKAHELGHARGTFRVGLAHLEGSCGAEQAHDLALAYLRQSLERFILHQSQNHDHYGSFKQYMENDFRSGAIRYPLVLDLLQLYADQSAEIKKIVQYALQHKASRGCASVRDQHPFRKTKAKKRERELAKLGTLSLERKHCRQEGGSSPLHHSIME